MSAFVKTLIAWAIDFGTCFSSIGLTDYGRPRPALNTKNLNVTPTALYFKPDKTVLHGESASKYRLIDPKNYIAGFKLWLIGDKTYTSPAGQTFNGVELAALFFKKMKEDIEKAEGKEITEAVLTCPTGSDQQYREKLTKAAELAGIKVTRLLDESQAAALAFGVDYQSEDGIVLVLDWGGGTLDCSVLKKQGTVFDFLAGRGDNENGGTFIDEALVSYVAKKFEEKFGFNPCRKIENHMRIAEQCTTAKHHLSEDDRVVIPLSAEGQAMDLELTREQFNQLINSFIERAVALAKEALTDAGLQPSDVKFLVLAGGCSKIKYFEERMEQFTGRKAVPGVSRELAVAIGATIESARKLGVVLRDESSKRLPDLNVITRTLYSLGLLTETPAGQPWNFIMIPKGTQVPYEFEHPFVNKYDDQTSAMFIVLKGESTNPAECLPLVKTGEYVLHGIPPMAAGMAQITVKFRISESGILTVHAIEKTIGVKTQFTIKASEVLSKDELQEAEKKLQQAGAGA